MRAFIALAAVSTLSGCADCRWSALWKAQMTPGGLAWDPHDDDIRTHVPGVPDGAGTWINPGTGFRDAWVYDVEGEPQAWVLNGEGAVRDWIGGEVRGAPAHDGEFVQGLLAMGSPFTEDADAQWVVLADVPGPDGPAGLLELARWDADAGWVGGRVDAATLGEGVQIQDALVRDGALVLVLQGTHESHLARFDGEGFARSAFAQGRLVDGAALGRDGAVWALVKPEAEEERVSVVSDSGCEVELSEHHDGGWERGELALSFIPAGQAIEVYGVDVDGGLLRWEVSPDCEVERDQLDDVQASGLIAAFGERLGETGWIYLDVENRAVAKPEHAERSCYVL